MKHLLIALAALFIVPGAIAAEPAPAQADAVAAAKAKPAGKPAKRAGKRHLPGGDLRQCLGLKSNEEVIKCSEGR